MSKRSCVRPIHSVLSTAAAILLLLAIGVAGGGWYGSGAAAEGKDAKPSPRIWLLDDCDSVFKDKDTYEDNLSCISMSGEVVFRVSGFNMCQSIGSAHSIATDVERECLWVSENVAHRIRKFDRSGKQLAEIKDLYATAVAVDPVSGNVWVLTSAGELPGRDLQVFDGRGEHQATYAVKGFDIAYDSKEKSFWIAGKQLTKISADKGEIAFVKDIAAWCASSVAVDPVRGTVWVAVRAHSQVPGSLSELDAFDSEGRQKHGIFLRDCHPMHVSVDPRSGAVWVTNHKKSVRKFDADGEPVVEHSIEALATLVDLETSDLWVATPDELVKISATKGDVLKRVKHKAKTGIAWLASF